MTTIKPNTKIRILSPEHSEYVQKLAFESGFGWEYEDRSCFEFWYFNANESRKTISSGPSELVFCSAESYQEIFIDPPNTSEKPDSSGYPLAKDLNGLQTGYYQVDKNTMNMPQLQDGWCGDICNSSYGHKQYVTFLDETGNEIHKVERYVIGDDNTSDWRPLPVDNASGKEWVDGLPPNGIECEFKHPDFGWVECTTIGDFRGDMVCAPNGGGFYQGDSSKFRPIETPEQAAKRKRDEWVKEKLEYIQNSSHALSTESEKLYMLYDMMRETGQLKESEE